MRIQVPTLLAHSFPKAIPTNIAPFSIGQLILAAMLTLLAETSCAAEIEWRVVNRFRLLPAPIYLPISYYSEGFRVIPRTNFRADNSQPDATDSLWPVTRFYVPANGSYHPEYPFPVSWQVKILVKGEVPNRLCQFLVDGKSIDGAVECKSGKIIQLDDQVHRIDVRIQSTEDGTAAITQNLSTDVHLKDLLIVGLGDSFASGEGNPDVPNNGIYAPGGYYNSHDLDLVPNKIVASAIDSGPTSEDLKYSGEAVWFDERCHRSLLSWQALLAWQVAHRTPHVSVTFLSFACSGAETNEGLLKAQVHRHYAMNSQYQRLKSPAQLAQLGKLLCMTYPKAPERAVSWLDSNDWDRAALGNCGSKARMPDLVLLSIGGNDVGFAPLISASLMHSISVVDDDVIWKDTSAEPFKTRYAKKDIKNLEQSMTSVAAVITALGIPSKKVVYATYPSPTHRSTREFCRDTVPASGKSTAREMLVNPNSLATGIVTFPLRLTGRIWLSEENVRKVYQHFFVPLSKQLEQSAFDAHWNVVPMFKGSPQKNALNERFFSPGYCVGDISEQGSGHFSVYQESIEMQGDERGTLHPNKIGHLNYLNRVWETAINVLGLKCISVGFKMSCELRR